MGNIGYTDLDPDMRDYHPGMTVIGRDTMSGDGVIKRVKTTVIPGNLPPVPGATTRIIPQVGDTYIVEAVNREVDTLMDDPDFIENNPSITRSVLVHTMLQERLAAARRGAPAISLEQGVQLAQVAIQRNTSAAEMGLDMLISSTKTAVAPQLQLSQPPAYSQPVLSQAPLPQTLPPVSSQLYPAQQPQPAYQLPPQPSYQLPPQQQPYYQQPGYPPAAPYPLQFAQPGYQPPGIYQAPPPYQAPPAYQSPPELAYTDADDDDWDAAAPARAGSDLALLGIPGLSVTPGEPQYCEVRDVADREVVRLRYHWPLRIDEEAIVLVYDMRLKPVRQEVKQRLLALACGSVRIAETKEAVHNAVAYTVAESAQVFTFGCFVFYYFILME